MQRKSFLLVLVGVIAVTSMILPLSYVNVTNLLADQISSIINLLKVFGADQTTINNVNQVLNGNTGTPVPTPVPVPTPTSLLDYLSAGLLSMEDDKAGAWGIFSAGPGAGGRGTTSPKDWNISASLKLSSSKVINYVNLEQTNGEHWSTNNSAYFPLVIIDVGRGKLTDKYTNNLGNFSADSYVWTLYAQKVTDVWLGGYLTVTFSDGTQVKSYIPRKITSTTDQPKINNVAGKAAGNFEIDAGGSVGIMGVNLTGYKDATNVYIGGKVCTITQLGNNLIYCTAPSDLIIGNKYDLYINSVGIGGDKVTSNIVQVKVLTKLPTIQPSITVLSPNGGEKIKAGTNYTVRWNSSNIPTTNDMKVYIVGKAYSKMVGSGSNTGSLTVLIPSGPNGDYEFMVETAVNGKNCYGSSSAYVFTSPIVLSPNGGESYMPNQQVTIGFMGSVGRTYINLVAPNGTGYEKAYDLISFNNNNYNNINDPYYPVKNDGLYESSVTLFFPKDWVASWGTQYKIELCSENGCDKSDHYFTISSQTTTQPTTITVLIPTNSYRTSLFRSGENIRFEWSLQNMSGIRSITLVPTTELSVSPITVVDTGDTGIPITNNYYDWTVPTNVSAGKYYIRIQRGSGSSALIGKSDGHITIFSSNLPVPIVSTVTVPATLSASLLSTSEDWAGSYSVFGPGTDGSLSPQDWNLSANLNLPDTKNIKSIFLNLSDSTGIWSTNNISHWPLVVVEGDRQLASSYVSTLGSFAPGNHSWKIYAQKNGTVWPGGKLIVTFDDNTTVSAEIPTSANISM